MEVFCKIFAWVMMVYTCTWIYGPLNCFKFKVLFHTDEIIFKTEQTHRLRE